MTTVEAERVHDGLVATLRAVASVIDGSTFEERKGYRLLACPSVPLPPFNSLSIDGPDDASVAAELASAVVTIEEDLGAPCWIVMREGSAPASEAEARRLGFTEVESSPGMAMTADRTACRARLDGRGRARTRPCRTRDRLAHRGRRLRDPPRADRRIAHGADARTAGVGAVPRLG